MTMRFAMLFFTLTLIACGPGARLLAHDGHDHKVMGTVTAVASDHLTLEDTDGKAVMVHVTSDTKTRRGKQSVALEDVQSGTRVVVTASTVKDKMVAKLIEVGVVASAK